MKHLIKKTFSIALITNLLIFGSVFYMLPFSYAADTWEDVTTNEELAEAFRYYCKSRNLAIEGSVAYAITKFTTSTFNYLCNEVGVDITALQANIKKSTDSNGKLQFLFDASGISAYNRIFAEFLQNNNLSIGDNVEQKNLINGWFYQDKYLPSYSCFVYVNDSASSSSVSGAVGSFTYGGTALLDNGALVASLRGLDASPLYIPLNHQDNIRFNFYFLDANSDISSSYYSQGGYYTDSSYRNMSCIKCIPRDGYDPAFTNYGSVNLIYNVTTNKLYAYIFVFGRTTTYLWKPAGNEILFTEDELFDATVYITTNNTTINNNTYEGDTIINQDGDTGGDSGGGSGGGGDTNINVDFPHITLPDLSGIDWSLDGLASKFPFCIPFDLYHFVDVLDAEPETPAFTGSINLIVTTWDLDYDLSAFDDLAAIVRNVEFIGFCLGLIFITRKIIKG